MSVGTISNYLNRPEVVAAATQARIQEVIDEHRWVPNVSGRTLRKGRSDLIGLVVLDVTNPFFTEVARGVEDAVAALSAPVVLCNTDGDEEREAMYLRLLEQHRARGTIITPARAGQGYLEEAQRRGMELVLLDRVSITGALSSVTVDDVEGGELAGRHLIERGHRQVGHITGPLRIQQCRDRLTGLQQAVASSGGMLTHMIEATAMRSVDGEAAATKMLASASRPTAVFCANDLLALGTIRAAHRLGLRVPTDVAIVGYDDLEFVSELNPALTTVRQPKYELGRRAVELLAARLDDVALPAVRETLHPVLVERAST